MSFWELIIAYPNGALRLSFAPPGSNLSLRHWA